MGFDLKHTVLAFALSVGALWGSVSQADTVLNITDAGNGNSVFELSGSFDHPSIAGPSTIMRNAGGVGVSSFGQFSSIGLFRATSDTSSFVSSRLFSFQLNSSSGSFGLGDEFRDVPSLSFDGYSLNFLRTEQNGVEDGRFGLEVADGAATSGTWNERFVVDIPFSSFNAGIWDFGSFGGAPNDGARLQIGTVATGPDPVIAPVPLPASGALILFGMLGFAGARLLKRR